MGGCACGGTAKAGVTYQVVAAGKVLGDAKTLPEARVIRASHGGTGMIKEVPAAK